MYVRFWGTRGSIAAPGPSTARYGGNTSCVEVRADDGSLFVLDCGTGARALGLDLARRGGPLRVSLLIGHTHWDHIQGFPFFVPAFLPDVELNIYAPMGFQRGLEEAMAGQMEYSYFPVKLRDLRSRLHFIELEEGFFRVGGVRVETQYLNHTAPTIAYRISTDTATVAYVTDHEPFWAAPGAAFQHPGDEAHVAFLRGADLVIHDAQYGAEEYASKVGWGHSTVEYAVDVALAAGVRRLALFHHDPGHDDPVVEGLERRARERAGSGCDVFAAREGLAIDVRGAGGASPVASVSALSRRPIEGGRVLIVSASDHEAAAIEEVLAVDELSVTAVPDRRAALGRVAAIGPDVAIVDARLPDGDGATLARELAEHLDQPGFPVLLLTEAGGPPADAGIRDWLAKPFSPPMLHARVRAWLSRAMASTSRPADRTRDAPPEPPADHAGMLGEFALFRGLPPETLARLVAGASELAYPAGHVIIGEGEIDDRIFVVLAGRVRVVESMPDTLAEAVLGGLGVGEIFGELSALTDRPRSATVIAIERSRCLALRQDRFNEALRSCPELSIRLLRVVARRLLEADRRLARFAPDTVTGLASRRGFHEQYRRLAAGGRRRKTGVLLMLFDVRQLRDVNDRFGYTAGDEVLRSVADALRETTRSSDLVARLGVDEFAVLLSDAGSNEAGHLVPRIGEKLAELSARRNLSAPVQCRVGWAFREVPPESADELLREADEDMRRGKVVPG